MNCSYSVFKYNKILQWIYLIVKHFTCIVLQQRKFHCHYSNLQGENLGEICSLVELKKIMATDTISVFSFCMFEISRRGICLATAG